MSAPGAFRPAGMLELAATAGSKLDSCGARGLERQVFEDTVPLAFDMVRVSACTKSKNGTSEFVDEASAMRFSGCRSAVAEQLANSTTSQVDCLIDSLALTSQLCL